MAAPKFNLADWPLDMSGCPQWTDSAYASVLTADVKHRLLTTACHAVWSLGGRRWATGVRSIRPRTECGCRMLCSHPRGQIESVLVRQYLSPVIRTYNVYIGTTALVEGTDYWLSRSDVLPVTGGRLDPWPTQDFARPPGHADTWQIVVQWGEIPPGLAIVAVQDLVAVMVKRLLGVACEVPENAMSVTREGVTIKLAQGLAAIPNIRALLDAYPKTAKARRFVDPARFRGGTVDEIPAIGHPDAGGAWESTDGKAWIWVADLDPGAPTEDSPFTVIDGGGA